MKLTATGSFAALSIIIKKSNSLQLVHVSWVKFKATISARIPRGVTRSLEACSLIIYIKKFNTGTTAALQNIQELVYVPRVKFKAALSARTPKEADKHAQQTFPPLEADLYLPHRFPDCRCALASRFSFLIRFTTRVCVRESETIKG